jgi:hypothetical protein
MRFLRHPFRKRPSYGTNSSAGSLGAKEGRVSPRKDCGATPEGEVVSLSDEERFEPLAMICNWHNWLALTRG